MLVERNTFVSCGGVAIGSEVAGGVENVVVRDNTFGLVGNVARVKSCVNYGGFIKNISFVDNTITSYANQAVFLDACYECPCGQEAGPTIDVSVSLLHGAATSAGNLSCAPSNPCHVAMYRVNLTNTTFGFSCSNVEGTATQVQPLPCW